MESLLFLVSSCISLRVYYTRFWAGNVFHQTSFYCSTLLQWNLLSCFLPNEYHRGNYNSPVYWQVDFEVASFYVNADRILIGLPLCDATFSQLPWNLEWNDLSISMPNLSRGKHDNKADHELLSTLGECANLLYVRVWVRIKPFVFVWLLEHGHQAGGRGLGRNHHHLLCRYWPHLHSSNNAYVPNGDFLRWVKPSINKCSYLL